MTHLAKSHPRLIKLIPHVFPSLSLSILPGFPSFSSFRDPTEWFGNSGGEESLHRTPPMALAMSAGVEEARTEEAEGP